MWVECEPGETPADSWEPKEKIILRPDLPSSADGVAGHRVYWVGRTGYVNYFRGTDDRLYKDSDGTLLFADTVPELVESHLMRAVSFLHAFGPLGAERRLPGSVALVAKLAEMFEQWYGRRAKPAEGG